MSEEAKAIHDDNSKGGGHKAVNEAATKETKDKALTLINEKQSSEMNNGEAIRDVWLGNFFQAMETISSQVDEYPYISMVSNSNFFDLFVRSHPIYD